jgi:peptidoglycan/LPS O-acetylase OafA/YrhL
MAGTTSHSRIAALDGWRGLAILLVLAGHFLVIPGVDLGRLGVEFFFVLSGRLMADILFVKKVKLPEFYWRRATRILPALAVFAVAFWGFGMVAGPPFQFSFVWVIASLTFTINYVIMLVHGTGWLDHLWSLCVEEHSYMLLGFLAFAVGRAGKRPLAAIWTVGLLGMVNGAACTLVFGMGFDQVFYRSDVHLASVFVSAALYLTVRHHMKDRLTGKLATPIFLVSLIIGVAFSFDWAPPVLIYTVGTTALAMAVALADIAAKPITAALSAAPLRTAGVLSYSVYLWQQPFYKVHVELYPGSHPLPFLLAAVAIGVASYYLVEQPSRKRLNALWSKFGKAKRTVETAPETVRPAAPGTV